MHLSRLLGKILISLPNHQYRISLNIFETILIINNLFWKPITLKLIFLMITCFWFYADND